MAAENHALIMWIGEYSDPRANLPGIELDAKNARAMALQMGVPEKNIVVAGNKALTLAGMAAAIAALTRRIQPGDKVVVYYSGHGAQSDNTAGGKKCSEGMVAQDVQLYFDRDLERDLAQLGSKASEVVMFNDSCFSGGAATKSLSPRGLVPKALPDPVRASAPAGDSGRACGDAVNKGLMSKDLEVVRRRGAQLLYVAAAAENEVSYATAQGSLATQAWVACMSDPAADIDHSGSVNGDELRRCAQARIDQGPGRQRQTITLAGTPALPVSFVAQAGATPAAPIDAVKALEDIRAGSDASYAVRLTAASAVLHIASGLFDFTVETNQPGYLYLLQVGTDGKRFTQLFPNKVDADNRVGAGSHRFPRDTWQLRAAGPAGSDHLLALVSSTPKDFTHGMERGGTFSSTAATPQSTKDIVVVATGANVGGNGRYGASAVLTVQETP